MLEFEHVSLTRRNAGEEVPVLRDVSFWTPPGKVFAILGPSGSGKSTLLRLACRLDDPDEGRVLLGGKSVREMDVLALRRRVGFVFQEPILFGKSVEENLRFAVDPAAAEPVLEDPASWLEMVGLPSELLSRPPDALSVGQRQRVALARALIPGPEVLLLDEPTSALDPQAATGILRVIRELRDKRQLSVIFVSHVIAHAREVADRVLVLKDGKILEEGGTDLFLSPTLEDTRAFFAGEEQ
jgi:UDP-glucose/iron transport system ATP-binding protein